MQLISWLLLACIHITPALALVRPQLLTSLYRLPADSPLFLLMQHRAALFFGIVVICIWRAFDPASRRMGTVIVAISMISFLLLYWQAGSPIALKRIALVDIVGLGLLAYVACLAFTKS
jgi:amino acid permease